LSVGLDPVLVRKFLNIFEHTDQCDSLFIQNVSDVHVPGFVAFHPSHLSLQLMPKKLSVAVCTHNPRADYLVRVLDALKCQTMPKTEWDLLLVDNASTDAVATGIDLGWHPRGRHVREERLGLTEARFRAIAETDGELIVFVDDDNVLAGNYLEEARRVSARFQNLGVFGSGAIDPEFEVPPPSEILKYLPLLAVRHVAAPRWSNHLDDYPAIPCGAGLVVMRSIAERYQQYTERLGIGSVLGRKGKLLYSGDDDLFSSLAVSQGLGFGMFPQLRVTHLIGRDRLTRPHVLKLVHDHTLSAAVRHFVTAGTSPPRSNALTYAHVLFDGLRSGLYSMRCRTAAMTASDRAARFVTERKLHPIETPHADPASLSKPLRELR
jgi:Glycosyl transferase family 2